MIQSKGIILFGIPLQFKHCSRVIRRTALIMLSFVWLGKYVFWIYFYFCVQQQQPPQSHFSCVFHSNGTLESICTTVVLQLVTQGAQQSLLAWAMFTVKRTRIPLPTAWHSKRKGSYIEGEFNGLWRSATCLQPNATTFHGHTYNLMNYAHELWEKGNHTLTTTICK